MKKKPLLFNLNASVSQTQDSRRTRVTMTDVMMAERQCTEVLKLAVNLKDTHQLELSVKLKFGRSMIQTKVEDEYSILTLLLEHLILIGEADDIQSLVEENTILDDNYAHSEFINALSRWYNR